MISKKELKDGDILTYRNGEKIIYNDNASCLIKNMNEDLSNVGSSSIWDIVKVERNTKEVFEREEPLSDDIQELLESLPTEMVLSFTSFPAGEKKWGVFSYYSSAKEISSLREWNDYVSSSHLDINENIHNDFYGATPIEALHKAVTFFNNKKQ